MSRGNNYDDEALARALQIEYEKEYRRRSMHQHLSVNGGSARNSVRNPVPSVPSVRPPPLFVPSAPIDNIYIEDDDPYFDRSDVQRVGSHRGATAGTTAATPTGSIVVPHHSFTLADDDAFGSVEISDEAFARQIEQELIQEELLRNQRKQHLQQQRDSYRASNRGTNEPTGLPPPQGRALSTTPPGRGSTRNNAINPIGPSSYATTDYVSRSSHSRNHSLSSQNSFRPSSMSDMTDSRGVNSHRNMTKSSANMLPPAVTGTALMYSDEELAQKLQQEMRDEELARQEFIEEQIRQSSIAARTMSENNDRSSRQRARTAGRRGRRRCISCLTTLVLIGIAVALVLYFYVGVDKIGGTLGDPNNFRQEDPFNNANKADANLWKTKGGVGLQLTIVNAVDSTWQTYFFKAVSQWDAGSPDALTLTTEDATPDSVCNAIDGKLKVCNGNYGATNWRGINKVLLENGWIYSSAARMNEYYTTDNDSSQRQYTMCHEVRL
jgi:hypothetical protein